jgi:diaminohydroxyphosphoribosylaminopyrimidine deaminase/5-amino-6-(5-phosphoribosylamino)uracil reductase
VHKLRNEFDCVLIGATTATQDNPQLTVHGLDDGRDPVRAVFDTKLSIDPNSRLCQKDSGGQTIIFCAKRALDKRGHEFPKHVSLIACDKVGPHIDAKAALGCLKDLGVLTVLCEGGSRLAGALIQQGLVDEIQWIVSPKIIGDSQAIPAITSFSEVLLNDALQLSDLKVERLGNDTLVAGTISDWL